MVIRKPSNISYPSPIKETSSIETPNGFRLVPVPSGTLLDENGLAVFDEDDKYMTDDA